jgi:hypothetical protein
MSMSQDTQNFDQLRRLLALKRHEQPPPGYFNDFSRQVIIRIKAGDRGEETAFIERLLWEAPWLRWIWGVLEAKPILAGVCSVAVCGLLISGLIYSERADVPAVALVPVSGSGPMAQPTLAAAEHPLLAQPAMIGEASSTSPLASTSTEGPLLGDIAKLRAQPAGFTFPAGN